MSHFTNEEATVWKGKVVWLRLFTGTSKMSLGNSELAFLLCLVWELAGSPGARQVGRAAKNILLTELRD